MSDMLKRKNDHINLVLEQQKSSKPNAFDNYRYEHNALPEANLHDVKLATEFLGFKLKLPFLISSMTGGPFKAEVINRNLAEAAQHLGIAMGVGSQRIALQHSADNGINLNLRKAAPSIPIFANIGAAQLRRDFGPQDIQRAIDMIEANALILHFNPLQEAIQAGGDVNWQDILIKVEQLAEHIKAPIIAKEVGMGLSGPVAQKLVNAGVSAIDVAGCGGTSFSQVEGMRAKDVSTQDLGQLFADWGIPTPTAIQSVRKTLPDIPLIASGGIRHGLDAAKALALGADVVGQAGSLLNAAMTSTEAVVWHFETMAKAIKITQFCSQGKPFFEPQTERPPF